MDDVVEMHFLWGELRHATKSRPVAVAHSAFICKSAGGLVVYRNVV